MASLPRTGSWLEGEPPGFRRVRAFALGSGVMRMGALAPGIDDKERMDIDEVHGVEAAYASVAAGTVRPVPQPRTPAAVDGDHRAPQAPSRGSAGAL